MIATELFINSSWPCEQQANAGIRLPAGSHHLRPPAIICMATYAHNESSFSFPTNGLLKEELIEMYYRTQWPPAPQPMPTPFPATAMPPMSVPPTSTGMTMPPGVPSGVPMMPIGTNVMPGIPPIEESYVENILRMNLGKVATLYMTYENNSEWNAKIFKGVLEAAGRDHIIISDPATGKRFLLLMVNLDYITFDEPLIYNLPFGSAGTATGR